MPANPQWPAILTNASWQKEKGKVSKLAGKTGVGEAMNAAQADFLKIDWNTIAAEDITPKDRTCPSSWSERRPRRLRQRPVETVRQKIKVIRDKAHATAESWKKNKKLVGCERMTVTANGKRKNNCIPPRKSRLRRPHGHRTQPRQSRNRRSRSEAPGWDTPFRFAIFGDFTGRANRGTDRKSRRHRQSQGQEDRPR